MMLRRLFLLLGLLSALQPGETAAAEVTWQEVAQSLFIVAGTPVPYERSSLPPHGPDPYSQTIEIDNPVFLKGGRGGATNVRIIAVVERDAPIVWRHQSVFFLKVITDIEETGDGSAVHFSVSWVHSHFSPPPRLYSAELAREVEFLVSQNERYQAIGAVYMPHPSAPLLLAIKQDLQEISSPPDFQTHRIAVQRLLDRGVEAVPFLISLIDDWRPFPYGSITYGRGDPMILDGPVSHIYPQTMVDAIDMLLSFITGINMASLATGGDDFLRREAIAGWQTYLGRLLADDLPKLEP